MNKREKQSHLVYTLSSTRLDRFNYDSSYTNDLLLEYNTSRGDDDDDNIAKKTELNHLQ